MKRIYQNQHPYFVTTNTIKLPHGLFEDMEHATIAANAIRVATTVYHFDLYGFVIMPNHIHLLLRTYENEATVSTIMKGIKDAIYQGIRRVTHSKEAFWQKSFYATIKDTPELLYTTMQYMKSNPVKWNLPEYYRRYLYQYFNAALPSPIQ